MSGKACSKQQQEHPAWIAAVVAIGLVCYVACMSYGVHIKRTAKGTDDNPIPLAEWLDFLRRDSEMELQPCFETKSPSGEVIRIPTQGLAVWTGHPDHSEKGAVSYFDWHQGEISVGNPDEPTISKMIAIAHALNARVEGDEGEYYDED
jgi:hypothetical protein